MGIVYAIICNEFLGDEPLHSFTTAQYFIQIKDSVVILYRMVNKDMGILLTKGLGSFFLNKEGGGEVSSIGQSP